MTKARDFAMMVGRSEALNPTRVALLDGNTITLHHHHQNLMDKKRIV